MGNPVPDLWPDTLTAAAAATPDPAALLREQAALLGQKTGDLVLAEVETSPESDHLLHTFYLVAPNLENYHYRLFSVWQPLVGPYPVRVLALRRMFSTLAKNDEMSLTCGSEAALTNILKRILGSDVTVGVINTLMNQSRPQATR